MFAQNNISTKSNSLEEACRDQYQDSRNLRARMNAFDKSSSGSFWEQLWSFYEFKGTERILKLGGGNGQFWFQNRLAIPDSLQVVLTDLSAGMVKEAQARLGETQIQMLIADAHTLTFESGSFDWVLAHFMFYHLEKPDRALGQISRVLNARGRIGVVLPLLNLEEEPVFIKWCFQLAPHLEDMYRKTSATNFGAREFEDLVNNRLRKVRNEIRPNNLFLEALGIFANFFYPFLYFRVAAYVRIFGQTWRDVLINTSRSMDR